MSHGNNLINSILCCLNPKLPITSSHYMCGSNLALFTSIAQVENCLTSLTQSCKHFTNNGKYLNCRENNK